MKRHILKEEQIKIQKQENLIRQRHAEKLALEARQKEKGQEAAEKEDDADYMIDPETGKKLTKKKIQLLFTQGALS